MKESIEANTALSVKKVKIKGINGEIDVNENGTIISYKGQKIATHKIKSNKHSKGYMACSIAGRSVYVHKLVAEAFVRNERPMVYKLVLHKNGDTLDNHWENLEWGDAAKLYEYRVKLKTPGVGVTNFDESYRGSSQINYDEALKIAERLDNGEFAKDICKEYNVSEMSIARIRKRYCKNKVASPRYDKSVKDTVLKLAEKYPANHVAKITGINYHTVYRWVKKAMNDKKK